MARLLSVRQGRGGGGASSCWRRRPRFWCLVYLHLEVAATQNRRHKEQNFFSPWRAPPILLPILQSSSSTSSRVTKCRDSIIMSISAIRRYSPTVSCDSDWSMKQSSSDPAPPPVRLRSTRRCRSLAFPPLLARVPSDPLPPPS